MQTPIDDKYNGYYVNPTVIEIENLNEVSEEIFGPIIHVYRYSANKIEDLIKDINSIHLSISDSQFQQESHQ